MLTLSLREDVDAELPVLSDAEKQKTALPLLKCENTFDLCKTHI